MTTHNEAQRKQMDLVRERFTRTAAAFSDFALVDRAAEAEHLLKLIAPSGNERALDVGNVDVENRVAVVIPASTDAARNSNPVAGRAAVNKAVVPLLGDTLRDWGGRVELPPEEGAVVGVATFFPLQITLRAKVLDNQFIFLL